MFTKSLQLGVTNILDKPPPDDERYFEICREIYGNTLAEHPDVIRAAGGAPDIAENSADGAVSAFREP